MLLRIIVVSERLPSRSVHICVLDYNYQHSVDKVAMFGKFRELQSQATRLCTTVYPSDWKTLASRCWDVTPVVSLLVLMARADGF